MLRIPFHITRVMLPFSKSPIYTPSTLRPKTRVPTDTIAKPASMLTKVARASGWSNQGYTCLACRRQPHPAIQHWGARWSSEVASTHSTDTWEDTLNNTSDEYPTKPEGAKARRGLREHAKAPYRKDALLSEFPAPVSSKTGDGHDHGIYAISERSSLEKHPTVNVKAAASQIASLLDESGKPIERRRGRRGRAKPNVRKDAHYSQIPKKIPKKKKHGHEQQNETNLEALAQTEEIGVRRISPRAPRATVRRIKSSKKASTEVLVQKQEQDREHELEQKQELGHEQSTDAMSVELAGLDITPVDIPQPPVPYLEYGLSRVLFNPGVYALQDPTSRVYNFSPYLQKIMPVAEFDFDAVKQYKTSSQDHALTALAGKLGKKYLGSTSSMTSSLVHFHYLISNWRPLNLDMLSAGFVRTGKLSRNFTKINRAPSAVFLRWKNGTYAIDADKEHDGANILMLLGKAMELLLTLPTDEYEKYRKSDRRKVPREQQNGPEAYQYTTMGDLLMRSQLDACDPRLPGNGTFDLKTRAVVTVRMSAYDHERMTGYEIYKPQGNWCSYEREYYDMIRATMLKYMLQARMGRMNGLFVAYHNVKRIFGFQYITISDMDLALHGQEDTCLGDQEFKASLKMLNDLLDKAIAKFPEQSLRIHFETQEVSTRDGQPTALHMFAEPMTDEAIENIQNKQKAKIEKYKRAILGQIEEAEVPEDQVSQGASAALADEGTTNAMEGTANAVEDTTNDTEGTANAIEGTTNDTEGTTNAVEGEEAEVTEDQVFQGASAALANEGTTNVTEGTSNSIEDTANAIDIEGTPDDIEGTANPIEGAPAAPRVTDEPQSQPSNTQEDASVYARNPSDEECREGPLFYATITCKSSVNGSAVKDSRPAYLSKADKWTLDYVIKEYYINQRIRSQYEEMRLRRKLALCDGREDEDNAEPEVDGVDTKVDAYIAFLLKMSQEGAKIRKVVDELEVGNAIVSVDEPLPGNREKIESLEDYLAWLYKREPGLDL